MALPQFQDMALNTPIWVWAIFIYILIVGYKATRSQVIFLPRLFIIPAILMGLKYALFLSGDLSAIALYLVSVGSGLVVGGYLGSKTPMKIVQKPWKVELPGTYIPLVVLLSFFVAKYIFGYVEDQDPILAASCIPYDTALSGLITGYFLGRTLAYSYRAWAHNGMD